MIRTRIHTMMAKSPARSAALLRARKWTILIHRYLGIALSLVFLTWFASGIAMIYAGGMPALSADARLQRMSPLDVSAIRLTPVEAAARAGRQDDPGRVLLVTILNRPAYRFAGGAPATVFADAGDAMPHIGAAESLAIAGAFMNLPPAALRHVRVLHTADQWTIALRRQMPLHKIAVDDSPHTELYVSEALAEVVMVTTQGSRSLAWIAAIPHWMYFAPLRVNDRWWRRVVLWTSGLATVAVTAGLVLAVMQYRVRYGPLMQWHYLSGAIFGIFALTWVFSGFLSMEPWDWASSRNPGPRVADALSGGPMDLARFPRLGAAAWTRVLEGRPVREVELRELQGAPHYIARGGGPPLVVSAHPLRVRTRPFSVESILDRLKAGAPGVAIADVRLLSEYDPYYYNRRRDAPLPVIRVKFDDADGTWLYIDPAVSRVAAGFTRRQRLERWLYHGLHSLDFSFWYHSRPLWDIGVIALCSGGMLLSGLGVVIGVNRLRRASPARGLSR